MDFGNELQSPAQNNCLKTNDAIIFDKVGLDDFCFSCVLFKIHVLQ